MSCLRSEHGFNRPVVDATGFKKDDWPEKPERLPEAYTSEELKALLKAAEEDDTTAFPSEMRVLLLKTFLCTAMRDGEVAHLTYGDIKGNVWYITAKPQWAWKPKTKQSYRGVPCKLAKEIRERQKKLGKKPSDLIFPNTLGEPQYHLLRVIKDAAEEAGLKDIRVDDHKLRATAITRWLRNGTAVQDVMTWVGHKDPKIVMRYAERIKLESEHTVEQAHAAFDDLW